MRRPAAPLLALRLAFLLAVLIAGPASAQPQPALRHLAERIGEMSSAELGQAVARLSPEEMLMLDTYPGFASFVHARVCEAYPQAVMSIGGQPTTCAMTLQGWAETIQMMGGNMEMAFQHAAMQREELLILLRCGTGEIDAATCQSYYAAQSEISRRNHELMMDVIRSMDDCQYAGQVLSNGSLCVE